MMDKNKYKRLPYGISDFRRLICENYAYVDKTRYIEMMENEANPNIFFIRPRKFGKSLMFSTLANYYDLNRRDEFDKIFGSLYIGKNPTPEHNSYAILHFDFSGLNTASEEEFRESFSHNVQSYITYFLNAYKNIISDAAGLLKKLYEQNSGNESVSDAFIAARNSGVKIYVIIDEYDHFANDLIAMGTHKGKNFYKNMVAANGMVRDFYEKIKAGTTTGAVYRSFITGISPVMLDDLTSGYNIANVLTLNANYNQMLGFTRQEVEWLMTETGVDPTLINIDMEAYYNGYLFHYRGENRVYNPAMVMYFFNRIVSEKCLPDNIIDLNLKTDYGRLKRLIQNENNRNTLIQIVKEEGIVSEILEKFSIDMIHDDSYFVSLLFYMGLLTIDAPVRFQTRLRIPNYSIKTLYWEYILRMIREDAPEMTLQTQALNDAIYTLAMEGEAEPFVKYVSETVFSHLSDYDLQRFDEKYIQIMMLAFLFQSKIFVPMSEYEAVPGRADIFMPRNPQLPQVRYEWVFEIKYCKVTATEQEKAEKKAKGLDQVNEYVNSFRMKNIPDLKAALLVFTGKNRYEIINIQ